MANVKNRIAQVEKEAMFRRWFYFSCFLEGLSDGQIEEIALHMAEMKEDRTVRASSPVSA